MGFLDRDVTWSDDEFFDFDGDGKLDAFEQGAQLRSEEWEMRQIFGDNEVDDEEDDDDDYDIDELEERDEFDDFDTDFDDDDDFDDDFDDF